MMDILAAILGIFAAPPLVATAWPFLALPIIGALLLAMRKGLSITGAIEWLIDKPHRALVLALVIIAALGWYASFDAKGEAAKWKAAEQAEATAHLETIARTKAAALSAQLLAERNRAAVEAEWRQLYQEASDEFANLSHDNRSLVNQWLQLQAQQAKADQRGSSPADLPSLTALPEGSVQGSDQAIIPIADLYTTAEAFAQLEALIGFITAAQAVETSPPPSPLEAIY